MSIIPVARLINTTALARASGRPRYGTVLETLLEEGFDDTNLAARGWYDGNAPTISTTTTHTGAGSLEAAFTQSATNTSWSIKRHLFSPTPTAYVSYWVKYSTNWVGSGELFHPHEIELLSDLDDVWQGPSSAYCGVYVEHNYQSGGIPRMAVQDSANINYENGALPNDLTAVTEFRSVSGCNGLLDTVTTFSCFDNGGGIYFNLKEFDSPGGVAFQPSPGAGYKNNWNHVEVYYAMNSVVGGEAVADGIMQYAFNGALLIDRNNIVYRTGQYPNLKWQQFMFTPFMGSGSPVAQTAWYDDLVVATGWPTPPEVPPPTNLTYIQEPTSVVINTVMTPPVRVGLLDAQGNLVTSATDLVILAKQTGPGTLSGTLSQGAVAGIAEFDDLQLDTIGTYTLVATSPPLINAVSDAFAVSSGGGGGSGSYPHEPASTTLLVDYDTNFGNAANPPWDFISGTNNLATVTDATAPVNTSVVGRVTFNIGCCDGSGPAQLENFDRPASGWDDWYVSDWFKFSSNFNSNPADQKIFQIHYTAASGDQFIRFTCPGLGSDTLLTPRLGAAVGGQGIQNIGGVQMVNLNTWYQAEFIWTRATGRVRLWVTPQGGTSVVVADDVLTGYQVPNSGSEILFWWWGYGGSGAYPSGGGSGFIYHNHIRSSYVP